MTTLNTGRLESYVQTALWSSTDDDDQPLDNGRDIDDLAPITKLTMERELNQFFKLLELTQVIDPALSQGELQDGLAKGYSCTQSLYDVVTEFTDDEHIAHDFWLTRNHHGAGFWDGDYGAYGDQLTAIAQTFSEVGLYIGDDGLIYQE
jgi:hypothetical protein